ncbi:choice-of-anchor J domain-containing protein [Myroides indicus]|uniref:Cleaved adhesin domain-containing protein n=1 Tax=Myroides indicus TaxID=1323422 RepID=A0A4R7EW25_9FLAO|nr:choice-of-anchor J domain-containing protein [Myroides indicus]TDS57929.1 cleaved adhesin domain-containing protein [Myroides indicus]
MSKFTKIATSTLLLICSVLIFAINKEYDMGRLLFDIYNKKEKVFEASKEGLDNATKLNIASSAANVLFEDDFEGTTSKWTFANESNAWYIGSAVKNGGTKSLYISDDKGTSNNYSTGTSVSFAVSDDISIPSTVSDVALIFDYRVEGEGSGSFIYDYLEVWIVEDTFSPTAGTKLTTTDGILVGGPYTQQSSWQTETLIVDLSSYAGKKIKIVCQWANDSIIFYPPAAAIDNVELSSITCSGPKDMVISGIGTASATATWSGPTGSAVTEYELYLGTDSAKPDSSSSLISVNNTNTYNFTGLTPAEHYYVWYRSVCSSTDQSYWVGPVKFATQCTALTIPFWEGFNTDSTTIDCWSIVDGNNDSTSTTGDNIWKPYTISPIEGDQMMYFYGSSAGAPHDDWLISPAFTLDATKIYKLTYTYKTTTTYDNDFEVLLSENGTGTSDFTTTLLTKKGHSSSTEEGETLFLGGISGDVNIAWHVTTPSSATYVYLDDVTLVEVDCADPMNLDVKDIEPDKATILWEDDFNSSWEYVVQEEGEGYPGGAGTASTADEVTVTQDNSGANLSDNTEYEFYVRAKCADGTFGDWIGPFVFRTTCAPVAWPFTEDFETTSTTVNCWTVVDGNGDGTSTSNQWELYSSTTYAYEGTYSMRFYGTSGKTHDDWLVSPTIEMDAADIYQLTYYYRTNASYDNEFEVKVSTNGTDPSEFTTTLLASDTYKNEDYEKKILYITGVDGDANIGWHVTSDNTSTYVYLDLITLEKVDCIGPEDDIAISDLETDRATFNWTDTLNSEWETYVQPAGGGEPTGSGTLTSTKPVTVTRTNGTGSGNLQPNTEYEFWVRSTCGAGKNSGWIGPFTFRTPCDVQTLPFWEGFNTTSPTIDCWVTVDVNDDATSPTGSNLWRRYTVSPYEGDQMMYFYGTSTAAPHDDWLISPTFTVDSTKYYKLLYHYKTSTTYQNDFEVALSNNGQDPSELTKVLLTKNGHSDSNWEEEKIIIGGENGDINIGWHVTTPDSGTYLYIDNVFLEEIDCPEPMNLGSKDEEEEKATIYWEDNFGSDWEYIIQKSGGPTPLPTITGTATTKTEVVVDEDKNGDSLTSNTEYEFYVRTNCANGVDGEWSGPYKFKTACGIFTTPFWEGFNGSSTTIDCWTIIDGNDDSTSPTGNNIWHTSTTNYEGGQSMYFYGSQSADSLRPHDDWLISPTITFETGKTYRLKYHYRTSTTATYDYEFEVLLSDSGTDTDKFTTTVVPKNKYDPSTEWEEEYVFISGASGDVNIAWHVTSETNYTYLYIDNVFIEEVIGCREPLPSTMGVKDIEKDEATIFWDDEFGATDWEYYVQEAGGAAPSGSGTATTNKENTVTQDASGTTLEPNTEYEFYVRTDCGNGEFSIWQGPYQFITACDIYTTPFWEGFNDADKTYRCWTIIDGNGDSTSPTGSNIWRIYNTASGVYEGDQSMYFYGSTGTHDDWLISPTIDMNTGTYVLKYRYKNIASTSYSSSMEILLSSDGVDTTKFTTTILPTEVYQEGDWKEKVVFFTGVPGDVNLAWHVNSTGTTYFYLDDVTLKEVETCPEPYYVTVTGQTTTTIDIEWEQDGGATSWEVIVVDYGEDETATPVQTATVTGSPSTTITGLDEGKAYTIYVRAKCTGGNDNSDWSTPTEGGTEVGASDECSGAMNIPVNDGTECEKTVSGALLGPTESSVDPNIIPTCNDFIRNDVWFEFTATSDIHMLEVLDLVALPSTTLSPTLYISIYDQSCTAMVGGNPPIACYTVTATGEKTRILRDLTPGQQYYVRIGNYERTDDQPDFIFKLCLTTSDKGFLDISPSGEDYTAEELVKDVLVDSDCDLVSDVNYKVADGSPATLDVNTLGYFSRKDSVDFPFDEGIVLSTGEIEYVAGPFRGGTTAPGGDSNARGDNPHRWNGDKDLNDAIADAGGTSVGGGSMRSTELEFDFIPVKDSIHFEYLFASNSYDQSCTTAGCNNGAMFAAWLIDLTTGEGINLAKIPDTETPIALNTILDAVKSGKDIASGCTDVNVEYYWKHYSPGGVGADSPLDAAVDYAGLTKEMQSQTVHVVPGRKYHIKLAVMDFCTTKAHTSAVFFNAGSFDLGDLDLGDDLLVEDGNALCGGECVTIKSGLGGDEEIDVDVEIQWYKDGEEIPGATESEYEACESGTYKVVGRYPTINCEVVGEKVIEIYPAISQVVHTPAELEMCRFSLNERVLDLSAVEADMFADVDREDYTTAYYLTEEDASEGSEDTIDETAYVVEGEEDLSVYIRIEDTRTGCHEVFILRIKVEQGAMPGKPTDVKVCAEYTFPDVDGDQYYYTEPGAEGKEYKVGDILSEPGEHTIYLLQMNTEEGCYEETSFIVDITAPVTADVFEDQTLSCELYDLKPLSEHNSYYTEPGGPEGSGIELQVGMLIPMAQTIYVYASSDDGLCTDESSFTITYEDCPIPRGISPNGDGKNDTFDLSVHGVEDIKIYNRWGTEVYSHGTGYTDEWYGQNKDGKQLPDGTYYYVIHAHGKMRTGWVQINK